jgi:hypothetical protein
MADQKMLISGLRSQREIIDRLIKKLSEKPALSVSDGLLYDATTKNIEQNLRTLRKIVENQV